MERQNTNTNDNDGSIEDDDSLEDDSDDIIQQGIDRGVVTFFSRYISIEGKPLTQPMGIFKKDIMHCKKRLISKRRLKV